MKINAVFFSLNPNCYLFENIKLGKKLTFCINFHYPRLSVRFIEFGSIPSFC